MDFTLHCTLDKHGEIKYRSRNPGILENFSAPDGLSRRWILGILCLIFCRFFLSSPLSSSPSRAFDRALQFPCCIVPRFVHARQSRLLSIHHPPSSSPLIDIPFFSQIRFHWVFSSECRRRRRRDFIGSHIEKRRPRNDEARRERACVCVCVCVESRGIRVNLDHESRSCIHIWDGVMGEMEDGV